MAYYTIGQRKGLGIGGPGDAWFVVDKDPEKNVVYLAQGDDHPSLYAHDLTANEISWVKEAPTFPLHCKAKIRYRQPEEECVVTQTDNNELHVHFPNPQRAITLRQSIVFYDGDTCLGGGMIASKVPQFA